jgi:hypothetical protein
MSNSLFLGRDCGYYIFVGRILAGRIAKSGEKGGHRRVGVPDYTHPDIEISIFSESFKIPPNPRQTEK